MISFIIHSSCIKPNEQLWHLSFFNVAILALSYLKVLKVLNSSTFSKRHTESVLGFWTQKE